MSKQNSTQLTKESWSKVKLGDVITIINENEYDPLEKGFTKYVAGEHIESDKIFIKKYGNIKQDQRIIGSAFHRVFHKGQLLFGTRRAYLRKAGLATFDGICANTTIVLEPKNELISELFPFIFHWEKFQKYAIENSVGSTNPYVRWRDLANFEFFLPPIQHAPRISKLLWKIENAIQKTADCLNNMSTLQSSLISELLTKGIGHTKFKKIKFLFGIYQEFPVEWHIHNFEDELKFESGSTPTRSKSEYFTGDIPWVTSTDLNRGILIATLEKITIQAVKKTRLKIFPKGTVLIALYGLEAAGTRGKCCILGINASINQACMALLPSEKILPEFLFYYYLGFGEKIALNVAQGTKQQNLSEDVLSTIKIPIPSLSEQKKIISIIQNNEKNAENIKKHLSKLYQLRKDLTDSLLSQKITLKEQNNGI